MADEVTTIPMQQRYATQLAADLERNLAAQERLKAEEKWLRAALESLPTDAPGVPEATPEPEPSRTVPEAPIPQPRQEESSAPAASARKAHRSKGGTKAAAKKAATSKAPAAKASARKNTTGKNGPRKSGGPTLGELVLTILANTPGEPRTAAEVTEDLAQAYPERARDANNVRNALEGLVAKSLIERSKQKNSVHYTVQGQQSVSDPADGTSAELSPTTGATAGEKVPGSA
uniref:hypothetical protein n=1 Tax=Streptomyces chartreusis TaxID=1969 RepID=UPI003F49914B